VGTRDREYADAHPRNPASAERRRLPMVRIGKDYRFDTTCRLAHCKREHSHMKRTYTGSCHCGAVRYEVDVDLSEGTIKCNCSICAKARSWFAAVPPTSVRLLAGAGDLSEYRFSSRKIHHLFCKHCGVRPFSWGEDSGPGRRFYALNIAALDDASAEELAAAPVSYVDGRHDDFRSPPAETRHL